MQVIKNIKRCDFGDISFTVGVNRAMLKEGFKKFPQYWKWISENIYAKDRIERDVSLDFLFEAYDMQETRDAFVRYLFPKMLEYGENELKDCFTYEEQANEYVTYLEDNSVWDDYVDEEGNEYEGACTLFENMLMSVFQNSKVKKTSKLHLVIK